MHNLDEIIQNLLSVDWQSQFNFLHIPKIEALAKDVTIRALVMAGGSEVAKSLGIAVSSVQIHADTEESPSGSDLEGSAQPVDSKAGRSDPKVEPEPDFLSAQEIGFTSPVGVDPRVDPHPTPKPSRAFVFPQFKLPKIRLPKFKLNLSAANPLWWISGASLIVLGLLIFWLVWILPKAVVTISVLPKAIDEEVQLTLASTESSINFADRIVPAIIETVRETGEKLMETTGKKIVGDPAVGEVTIYNRTSSVKTFTKGTQLLASGGVKFTLDQDVTVASKSAGSDYVDVPGKSTVKITASAIGEDSNIKAGTEFTISSFGKDSFVGKNDSALAGGTSEEVRVVGKDDQKTLVKELTEELLLSLTSKSMSGSVPGTGVYLIEESAKVDSATYTAKVGETAKTLTVNLTLSASLLKYKTDDVTTLVNSSIDQAVPMGYVRANLPSTVELSSSTVNDSGTSVNSTAKVKVALLPVIDQLSLQSQIKGKKGTPLQNILTKAVPGYVSAEAAITPLWIPARFKSIPLNPRNITILIKPAI